MKWLKQLIGQLRCPHTSQTHVRNIHGDEINHSGGMRSVWKCDACGAMKLHAELKEGGYSHGKALGAEAAAAIKKYNALADKSDAELAKTLSRFFPGTSEVVPQGFAGTSWYGDGIFSPVTLKLLTEQGRPVMVESVLIGLESDCGEFSFGEFWNIQRCRLDSLGGEIARSVAYAVWLRAAAMLGIERIQQGAFDLEKDQRYMDVWNYINAQAQALLEKAGGWRGDLRTVAVETLESTLRVFSEQANRARVAPIFERSLEEITAHHRRVAHGILAEIAAEEAKCARS